MNSEDTGHEYLILSMYEIGNKNSASGTLSLSEFTEFSWGRKSWDSIHTVYMDYIVDV